MNESCTHDECIHPHDMGMTRVTWEWVLFTHEWVMYEWVMRTHEWVMSVWYVTGGLCHIRMGHGRCEESCHVWTIHVNSHESRDIWTNCVTYERVVSHKYEPCQIWIVVSRMSDQCDIEWVMGLMNESQNRGVDACAIWIGYWCIRTIHVTCEESWHVWMIHVTSNESWDI